MIEIIGYWVCTTLLIAPIWVALLLWVYEYLNGVYYKVPGNGTNLPFYKQIDDLFDWEPLFWFGVISATISLLFTFFAAMVGAKMKMGFVGGVIYFSHIISGMLSAPVSAIIYILLVVVALRSAVQFAAKFAVMRKKIDQLNK